MVYGDISERVSRVTGSIGSAQMDSFLGQFHCELPGWIRAAVLNYVEKTVNIFCRYSEELLAFVDTYVAEEDVHCFFIQSVIHFELV